MRGRTSCVKAMYLVYIVLYCPPDVPRFFISVEAAVNPVLQLDTPVACCLLRCVCYRRHACYKASLYLLLFRLGCQQHSTKAHFFPEQVNQTPDARLKCQNTRKEGWILCEKGRARGSGVAAQFTFTQHFYFVWELVAPVFPLVIHATF